MKKVPVYATCAICAALLLALIVFFAPTCKQTPLSPPSSQIESESEAESGEHPGFQDQWFEMKKNEDGIIPRGLGTKWYNYDRTMAQSRSRRREASPFSSVQSLGPHNLGGRTRALIQDASDPDVILAGAVSGGMWRSEDAGANWTALNDAATNLSVSCMVQSPFNPNIIYYGTGEPIGNSAGVLGDGVFKSTDGGHTFSQLPATASIWEMTSCWSIQHSKDNANELYVGTTSGMMRTQDAGASWHKVYSSGWITDIICFSDGGVMISHLSDGVYYSATGDSGTFAPVNFPFPANYTFRRIEIAEYQGNEDIIYAAFENYSGDSCDAFYKSTNGGATWTGKIFPTTGNTQNGYDFMLGVSAANPNHIVCGGVVLRYNITGGDQPWLVAHSGHADHHVFVTQPATAHQFLVGNDGGVFRYNWNDMTTPIDLNDGYHTSQAFAGSYGPNLQETVAGFQDNGTWKIGLGTAQYVNHMDGGFSHISQQDPSIAYTTRQEGNMFRMENFNTNNPVKIDINNSGLIPGEDDFRFIHPYEMNLADGSQLYCANLRHLWRTLNGGDSWIQLTNQINSIWAIGLTQEVDPSVWIGSSGGTLHYIANAATTPGQTEVDLSSTVPTAVLNQSIGCIAPHPSNPGTIYVSYLNTILSPKVYRVTNANTLTPTWENLTGDLPPGLPVNYIAADPAFPNNSLYAATDFGLYYSSNGGINWIKEDKVPNVAIHQCRIRHSDRKLFLFTHGRGVWYLPLATPSCSHLVTTFPYQEGFESGTGDWYQDQVDDFDWSRKTGSTFSGGTGPTSADEGSWYMYTESSSPNNPNKVSNLLSPCFDLRGLAYPKFSFRYHMYGNVMGHLALEASTDCGLTWEEIWETNGNHGQSWISASLPLHEYTNDSALQFRFNGTTGASYTSDMAIDDIQLEEEPQCLTQISAFPYSESFEFPLTQWKQSAFDDINWTRGQNGTPSLNTGPTSAIDGDYYFFTEASSPNYPTKKSDLTACFDFTNLTSPSINFRYSMNGADMGSLHLHVSTDQGHSWTQVFSAYGNQGFFWLSGSADLSAYSGMSQVMLRWEGITGFGYRSDMALDDIVVDGIPPTVRPTKTQTPKIDATVQVYPNPFQDQVTLSLPKALTGTISLSVFDPTGKLILERHNLASGTKPTFNTSEFAQGVYLLNVSATNYSKQFRIVKTN